jgi:hypothetical protein
MKMPTQTQTPRRMRRMWRWIEVVDFDWEVIGCWRVMQRARTGVWRVSIGEPWSEVG